MVVLDLVISGVFSFRTHVHNLNEGIRFGVIDRLAHKGKESINYSQSIVYGSSGRIYFSIGNDQRTEVQAEALYEGSEVLMEVDKSKCSMTFIVKNGYNKAKYGVYSPILKESNRQFVPAFETS
jgi:hypothetical protein